MCGFLLYQTQVIIGKRRKGDMNFIMHSLDLFMVFADIFRHIVVILLKNVITNKWIKIQILRAALKIFILF